MRGIVVVAAQHDPRVALVVFEKYVVAGFERLDPLVFEQQRLRLAARQADLDRVDLRHHAHDALDLGAGIEIAGHAFAQVGGFADIQRGTIGVAHLVDAGSGRQTPGKLFAVKTRLFFPVLSRH